MAGDSPAKAPALLPGAPGLPLRVLQLEDNDDDAALAAAQLRRAGLVVEWRRVETRAAFLEGLGQFRPDLVLADFRLPGFDGGQALALARERFPDVPVIIVSGTLVDDQAVQLLTAGAADYILKDRLARLAPAVRRVLDGARAAAERRETEHRYRALFELARDGVAVVDLADGHVVDANPEFLSQCGRSLDRLRGMPVWEICAPQAAAGTRARFLDPPPDEAWPDEEVELLRPDGSLLPVQCRARAFAMAGRRLVQMQVRDVSERRRYEAELHARIDELQRFQDATVDRELRMQELEQRLARLEAPAEH